MPTSVRGRNSLVVAPLALCLFSGCGTTPNTPVAPSSSQPRLAHLSLKVSTGETEVIHWASGVTEISYGWCYNVLMDPGPLPTKIVTIRKAENTVVGPDGSTYSVSSASFEGDRLGGTGTFGYFGCPSVYRDRDLGRPLATTYRMRIDYTIEGESRTFTVSGGGAFVPRRPPP